MSGGWFTLLQDKTQLRNSVPYLRCRATKLPFMGSSVFHEPEIWPVFNGENDKALSLWPGGMERLDWARGLSHYRFEKTGASRGT